MKHRDPRDRSPAVCKLRTLAPHCGTYLHFRMLGAFASAKNLTNDEAVVSMGMDYYGPCTWRRRTDLVLDGLVQITGEKRVSKAGGKQAVCRITPRGRTVWSDVRGKPTK